MPRGDSKILQAPNNIATMYAGENKDLLTDAFLKVREIAMEPEVLHHFELRLFQYVVAAQCKVLL